MAVYYGRCRIFVVWGSVVWVDIVDISAVEAKTLLHREEFKPAVAVLNQLSVNKGRTNAGRVGGECETDGKVVPIEVRHCEQVLKGLISLWRVAV